MSLIFVLTLGWRNAAGQDEVFSFHFQFKICRPSKAKQNWFPGSDRTVDLKLCTQFFGGNLRVKTI